MLKINLKNQKLKESSAHKETTLLLSHIFQTFFKTKNQRTRFPFYVTYWNSKFLFHSSFTKERTICFLTGRSRSVYRSFHLSRLKLREYAAAGYFSGLSKASW